MVNKHLGPRFNRHKPNGCECCFPAPRSKDRRARFRIAKRKAEREAVKQAEADMVDEWNEMMVALEEDDHYEQWLESEYQREYELELEREMELLSMEYENWFDDGADLFDDNFHAFRRSISGYPEGAIQSIEELMEHHSWVYVASREFRTCGDMQQPSRLNLNELADYNVIKLNGYNDWFVFTNRHDAEAWAQVLPAGKSLDELLRNAQ